jgi:hypothetical protein
MWALRKLTIKVNNISFPGTDLYVKLHKQSASQITVDGGQKVPIKSNSILATPSQYVNVVSNATDIVQAVRGTSFGLTRQPSREVQFPLSFQLILRVLLLPFFI